MLNLIRNEVFKIMKKKATWFFMIVWLATLILFPLLPGITFGSVALDFGMLNLLIVILASAIISEEFSQKTIKFLLTQMYTRTEVLVVKFSTILFMVIVLDVIQLLIAYLASFFISSLSFMTLSTLLFSFLVNLLLQLLLISISLLFSVVLNSQSFTTTLNILILIFGPLVSSLIGLVVTLKIWRFNPLSMMNVVSLATTDTESLTLLPLWQYILGILLYSAVFLAITKFVLDKKEVST